jgi:hypothetical protein
VSDSDALTPQYLAEFKTRTEDLWARRDPHPDICGFQFQRGTRWRPGLSADELAAYEAALGLRLPDDARLFFRTLNGTDRPTVDVAPEAVDREGHGVYSYPHDLDFVRSIVADLREDWPEVSAELGLADGAFGWPVFGHRSIVCSEDPKDSRVASIVTGDSIIFAPSLREWLELEFFRQLC